MRRSIRSQILIPSTIVLLVGVAVMSFSAAWLAAERSQRVGIAELRRMVAMLTQSQFPFASNVIAQMRELSGAEFAVLGERGGVRHSTLGTSVGDADLAGAVSAQDSLETLTDRPTVEIDGREFFTATVRRPLRSKLETLLVLYPKQKLSSAQWEAAWPPMAIGLGTLAVMIAVAVWLSGRMSRRIRVLRQHVAAIAEGDFKQIDAGGGRDEIQELTASVNRMSSELNRMRQAIRNTERSRLLGQLAGGLAHQLRNAVTGARMAIQIHQRRCEGVESEDSLSVALRQLALTEEQVKALLAVGRNEGGECVPQSAADFLDDIVKLTTPAAEHAGVVLIAGFDADDPGAAKAVVSDSQSVRTAVLNLLWNAVEAAGRGGSVELQISVPAKDRIRFDVLDSGPGPPADLAEKIFDVFVTSKPEGVGFGLALAKRVADSSGGSLTWSRVADRTRFRLEIGTE